MIFLLVLLGRAEATLGRSGRSTVDADGVPVTLSGAAVEP